MRFTFFIIAAFAVIALTLGNPIEDEQFDDQQVFNNQLPLARSKRFTCDILGSTPACAAHCIARGFRGGWCDGRSVCNCRR